MKHKLVGLVCLLVASLAVVPAFCQAPTGAIAGLVKDQTGAVIAGAKITVTNIETGLTRSMASEGAGTYSAASLPPGTYQVKIEAPGFKTRQRGALVVTGTTTQVDFTMEVGATSETILVEEVAPQLHAESFKIDGVVQRVQIENLPLNGRNFLQLAFLEPGVSVSTASLAQYNAQFSVSVLGGASSQTSINVDGVSIRNAIEGGSQQNFSQEVVQEFQISSVNFDLSTNITGVGSVNIVTRSGTNDLHGSGFFYFRDNNMAAYPGLRRDPLNPDPFFARRQSGFYVGGPIKKDKLFFFTNVEHINQDGVVAAQPRIPEFARYGGIFNNPYTGTQVSAKFDWNITNNHHWYMRYSHDGNKGVGPRSGTPLPSNWVKNRNWADQSVGTLTSTFGASVVNEARFAYTYWTNRNLFPTEEDCPGCIGLGFPQIDVSGAGFVIGNTTNAPQGRDLRRFTTADNLTWQKSSHRVRTGIEWAHEIGTGFWAFLEPAAMVVFSPTLVRQVAPQIPIPSSFNTVDDILRLPLAGFQAGIGDPSQPPPFQLNKAKPNNRFHLYVQDNWRVRPNFTLQYGLGYSYESNLLNHDLDKPAYLTPLLGPGGLTPEKRDRNNFSPSVGFAWNVGGHNKTVVRGGAGIYYNSWELYKRLIERSVIGPRGNGRFPIPGDLVPNPIPGIPGVALGRPLNFSTGPTAFTAAHLMAILPAVRAGLQQQLGNPFNTDLSVRNIEVFKSGSDLITNDFVAPYSMHYSFGVQRELMRDLVVSGDFVLRRFVREELENVDFNHWDSVRGPVIPRCVGAQQLDVRAQCSAGAISFRTIGGRSRYKALLVKVDKRMSNRWQLLASYALQDMVGLNGNTDKTNWFDSWGPRMGRHSLNVSGIVDLPLDFQVSFISQIATKGPFNVSVSGLDFNGDGTNGDRLPGARHNRFNYGLDREDLVRLVQEFNQAYAGRQTPRNQAIPALTLPSDYQFGDNYFTQDLRLSKHFRFKERYKLTIMGEVFNIFNIANLGGFSGNVRETTSFGQPSSRAGQVFGSGGPRAFQLAARFNF